MYVLVEVKDRKLRLLGRVRWGRGKKKKKKENKDNIKNSILNVKSHLLSRLHNSMSHNFNMQVNYLRIILEEMSHSTAMVLRYRYLEIMYTLFGISVVLESKHKLKQRAQNAAANELSQNILSLHYIQS